MVLEVGEYVHVIERRQFDSDLRRHFIGVVERVDGPSMRATGYTFVYDPGRSTYARSQNQRTRVIALNSGGLIINVVPGDTNLDEVQYVEVGGRLIVTDGGTFSLDINEFGRNR